MSLWIFFEENFLKKKLFLSFLDNEQKFFGGKKQYSMSRGTFKWSLFWKKFNLVFIFVYWANFFSFLSKDFPQDCQNWMLRVHRKPWKKVTFFWRNCRSSHRFQKRAKNIGLLAKTFQWWYENCFRRVHRIILRFLLKKVWYFHHSRTLTISFRHSVEVFPASCKKKLSKSLINSKHTAEKFNTFVAKIPAGLPRLLSTCLQEQNKTKMFLKKSLEFLLSFSDMSEKNLNSCQKCSLRLHRDT